jgi:hypothetical protein
MKRIISCTFLVLMMAAAALEAGDTGAEQDAAAVRKTIETAYVKGIHTDWDVELIKTGFHPAFTMFIYEGGAVRKLTIDEWSASIGKKKVGQPEGPDYEITAEIPMVDVTGNAAVARVELYKDGDHIYTDYMSLYRFDDGWKIVGKIYHKHE